MNNNKLSKKIFSGKIHQARHDHFLQIEDLAGFSGLTEIQIRSLEEGVNKGNCFVDDAHAIDCAKRIANSLGFPTNYFISQEINLHNTKNNVAGNQEDLENYSGNHKGFYNSNPISLTTNPI